MAKQNYPVVSSAISRIDYDDETGTCYFTMKDGKGYSINIPEIEVARWVNAESPGGYFNLNIRGKY